MHYGVKALRRSGVMALWRCGIMALQYNAFICLGVVLLRSGAKVNLDLLG